LTENITNLDGYYCLADLPQSGLITEHAFGTGWWELDEIIKFYLGQFVVVSGTAGHGKSTFLLNVLTRLAKKNKTRSFLYVPENEMHLRQKMKLIWGKEPGWDYFNENQCYVQSAIPHSMREPAHTLDWVLDRAQMAVQRDKCEVVLIDPWNELEHAKPRDLLMTDYVRDCLMLIKQFCRALNVVVIVVAHPTKAANGRAPTLADVEGSMSWLNKCDNGIICIRDFQTKATSVTSSKIREIGAGEIGTCHFTVDPATGIFTPQYGAVTVAA
jgi:twinkle protein